MKRLLLIVLFISAGFYADAQNWKTVRLNDTVYFSAGRHTALSATESSPSLSPDSALLRMIFICSQGANGGDSTYQFYRTYRDTAYTTLSPCVDTANASWLGYHFIRKADGTEYYFNSRKDTITILSSAPKGTSWLLAHDSSGINFMGTVSQAGVLLVDGVVDSVKTISIQAFSGASPVNNWYNHLEFQISKNHGWIKTLDLYRFPNSFWGKDNGGIALDSTQHLRVPASFKSTFYNEVDVAWRYAIGNEWIYQEDQGAQFVDNKPEKTIIRHDSVVNLVMLNSTTGVATIQSVQFVYYHTFYGSATHTPGFVDSFKISSFIHTDTVVSMPGNALVSRRIESDYSSAFKFRYFIQPYDTNRYYYIRSDLSFNALGFTNGCMRKIFTLNAFSSSHSAALRGFGGTAYYFYTSDPSIGPILYWRYTYIRTGGTHSGVKINVAALAVSEPIATHSRFNVYPNPADDHINITSSTSLPSALLLKNVTGQRVWQGNLSGSSYIIPTGTLPGGLYFLEIVTKELRQVIKVNVAH